ncbi:hypothetical protein IWQ61_001144 [Dispira simplex]|nr:hypothetical protein IWQ61_001144 [Dispira simplex]
MESLTQWSVDKVYAWFCSLGFQAYEKQIRDNEITGEVLIHLHHDALRDLDIHSLGKRLVILKAIYQLKVQHHIPITSDDYIPPDVDNLRGMVGEPSQTEVLNQVEGVLEEQEVMIGHLQREVGRLTRELTRMNHDFVRFKEDVRPMGGSRFTRVDKPLSLSVNRPTPILTKVLGSPKGNGSAASATVSGSNNYSTLSPMPGITGGNFASAVPASPSSPSDYSGLKSHGWGDMAALRRSGSLQSGDGSTTRSNARTKVHSMDKSATPPATTPLDSTGDCVIRVFSDKGIHREHESYKTFRVSSEDPGHKILLQALKKYNINDDWRKYTLCIMCGNQEHCLQLEDRPLHLFQQLLEANESPYLVLKSNRASATTPLRED